MFLQAVAIALGIHLSARSPNFPARNSQEHAAFPGARPTARDCGSRRVRPRARRSLRPRKHHRAARASRAEFPFSRATVPRQKYADNDIRRISENEDNEARGALLPGK